MFRGEIKKAALRVAEYPKAWSIERGDIRKCLLFIGSHRNCKRCGKKDIRSPV